MSRLPLPLRPRCTRRAPRQRRASPLLALALLLATLSGIAAPAAAHLSIIRQGPESRGAIEAGDYMGLGLAAGDFNGDGYDDIAMGAPGEDVNGEGADAGAVIIDFGSHFGITQVGAQLLTAGSLGQTGQAGAHFGQALAAGDFNHDGFDDLVIGAPLYDLAGHSNAGLFYVVYGSAGGLLASSVVFDESSAGGAIETGDEFGRSFAVGNFDGDASGIDDLAVGAPGEDNDAGAVAVNYMGGPLFGLTAGVATFFKQSTLGGIDTPGDRFGESLAAGNLVGSSHDDLAIGAPYQGGSLFPALGAVWVVKGSGSALTAGGALLYDANTVGPTQSYAYFGYALAVGRFFSGPYRSLAVGEPGRQVNSATFAGRVIVAKGGVSALDFSPGVVRLLNENSGGSGTVEPSDSFGSALAAGDFYNPDGYDDVAVGAPNDGLGVSASMGQFQIFPGGPSGPTGAGWSGFNQGTCNEPAEPGDEFGTTIAFGRFDATGKGGFAVSAPYEDYEDNFPWGNVYLADIGMVHIIAPWRQAFGLTCKRSTTWDCEGNPVFSQRPFDKITVASTTKILTLLIACERSQLNPGDPNYVSLSTIYTVPQWIINLIGGSVVPLIAGEQMSLQNLMYTMMMVSGNDAAHAIADRLGSGLDYTSRVTDFVNQMNARAAALGLAHSHFTSPNGFDQSVIGNLGYNYSTAEDMARLGREAMKNALVKQIVSTKSLTITRVVPGPDFSWTTGNFINNVLNAVTYADGIKGGGTGSAGITGVYSAYPPLAFGHAVMDEFGCPSKTAANAVKLFQLSLAECGTIVSMPLPQDEGKYSFALAHLSTQAGAIHGGTTELLMGPPLEDALIDAFRETGSGPTSAVLEYSRIPEVFIDPGQINSFGVEPFSSRGEIRILNMGDEIARIRVGLPESPTPTDYTLAPGEFVLLPGFTTLRGGSSYLWTIENQASGGTPLHLGVQESYAANLTGVGDPNITPIHSARFIRRGNFVNDQCTVKLTGQDPNPGSELYLVVHSPGVTVAVGDPPRAPEDTRPLRVLPAWPNPFRDGTRLAFDLQVEARIAVSVFDLQGRRVRAFPEQTLPPGRWGVPWDGSADGGHRLPSGVYFYRVARDGKDAGGGTVTRVK